MKRLLATGSLLAVGIPVVTLDGSHATNPTIQRATVTYAAWGQWPVLPPPPHHPRHRHHHHKPKPRPDPPPMATALASWYAQSGPGACGTGAQDGLAFASLILPCGAHVEFCYGATCVTATMKDHGPYVSDRTFDLNANLRSALACPDLCYVHWRRIT